jgi:hypothetical protein
VQQAADAEVTAVIDCGLSPHGPVQLEVLLNAGVLVVDVDGGDDPFGDDPGAEAPGVRRFTRRSKMSDTWSGRPASRLSRITSSKNTRPAKGRSSTWVRENSAWRMEIS